MNINIKFEGNITEDDSFQLDQLAKSIEEECLVSVQVNKEAPQAGVKDAGTLIGMAISLGLSTISTLIALLAYWQSRRPQYSIFLTYDNITLKMDNISHNELQEIISKIKTQNAANAEIVISRLD